MGWSKKLIQFWKDNLERNVKRISIALGAFLIFVLVLLPIPTYIDGAAITLGSIVIMSIFGKNGNGQKESEEEEEEEEEVDKHD